MHPIEGVIIIAAGMVAWLIGSGRLPADPHKRNELAARLPWALNRRLMYSIAVLLWMFGLLVLSGLVQ